jgi:hypothetical protein
VQLAQKLGKIAIARFSRRGLKGSSKRSGDAGVGWREVNANDLPIHFNFRRRKGTICIHLKIQRRAGWLVSCQP